MCQPVVPELHASAICLQVYGRAVGEMASPGRGAASTDSTGVSYTSHGVTYWCTGLSAAQLAAAVQAAQRKAETNSAEWERRLGPITICNNVEERAAAETDSLDLVPSSSTATGFKCVYKERGKYAAKTRENGKLSHLGTFATPEEAALCYARHVGAARAAAEAAGARGEGPQPLTVAEARATAAAEGLELVPSWSNVTGFKAVAKNGGKYQAKVKKDGKMRHLGIYNTPVEAALCYARHVGAARAAAEAAEAAVPRSEKPQPLTAAEARAAAAAEGLQLVPSSSSETGFKGVTTQNSGYRARVLEDGNLRQLGCFATPEQAALCYAQHTAKNTARSNLQRGKKRQRALQEKHEQQPSSHGVGSHRAPRLTQVGDVETVIIDRFVFRCCAVRRCSP